MVRSLAKRKANGERGRTTVVEMLAKLRNKPTAVRLKPMPKAWMGKKASMDCVTKVVAKAIRTAAKMSGLSSTVIKPPSELAGWAP